MTKEQGSFALANTADHFCLPAVLKTLWLLDAGLELRIILALDVCASADFVPSAG
jgi:hypothetical protein